MMRRVLVLGLVLAALLPAGAGLLRAADTPEQAAQTSAAAWLALVDAGKYGESWDAAASFFRSRLTRSEWEAALDKVRRPLGKLVSRRVRAAQYATSLPGAPAGEYVVIQYETRFAEMPSATETVTPMKEKDGSWRVSGYYIK